MSTKPSCQSPFFLFLAGMLAIVNLFFVNLLVEGAMFFIKQQLKQIKLVFKISSKNHGKKISELPRAFEWLSLKF